MLRILYFAAVKERMGRPSESFARPPDVTTVAALAAFIHDRDDAGRAAFANLSAVRTAVNLEFASYHTPISDDDEVAFFPPVTGG